MPPADRQPSAARRAVMRRTRWLIGLAATLFTIALWQSGQLRRLEFLGRDLRGRHFGFFSPPPSDRLALIAIDDQSIETLRLWPMPREAYALVVEELDRAGAAVVAFDVIFDEREPADRSWPPSPGGSGPSPGDARLARAVERHGGVVLAGRFGDRARAAGQGARVEFGAVAARLGAQPDLTFDELRALMAASVADDDLAAELQRPGSPASDDLRRAYETASSLVRCVGASSVAAGRGRAWPSTDRPVLPIPEFSCAAAAVGNVSFRSIDADGQVRRLELWWRVGDRLFPGLAVAATARLLDADAQVRIEGARTVVPGAGAALPMEADARGRDGQFRVVWPRAALDWSSLSRRDWRRQFGSGADRGMVSIGRILDPYRLVDRLRGPGGSVSSIERSVEVLHDSGVYSVDAYDAYRARAAQLLDPRTTLDDWLSVLAEQRTAWAQIAAGVADRLAQALPEGVDLETGENLPDFIDAALRERLLAAQRTADAMPLAIRAIDESARRIADWRDADLPRRVGGRLCFVGWVASAVNTDVAPTVADPRTPGVLIHMAVANSILTGHVKIPAAWWADALAIGAMGLVGAWIGIRLSVVTGPIALVGLVGAWHVLNGLVWDAADLSIAPGAPAVSGVLAWLAVMLHRLLLEQRRRRRTEARFRSYVADDVVDILVNNPALDSMVPQRRELTVMFSDIAGFTPLAERLGTARTGEVLSTYLARMTDVLAEHRATLDKFLGDGVMAFWGAPVADPDHAKHGVEAIVAMFGALDEMNAAGAFGEHVRLEVRVGMAAGEVNVGDFGNPPHKSAYTVIGDAVNLAARLESACKQLGARALITGRVRDLAGPGVRVRPVGWVVVTGKTEPEWLGEPVAGLPHADRTDAWIASSQRLVDAYRQGDFDACRQAADELEHEFDEAGLADIYRTSIAAVTDERGRPTDGFGGYIRLERK